MRSWYYFKDGKRFGPVSEDELIGMMRSGELSSDVYVWTRGMRDWVVAHEVKDLVPEDFLPPPVGLVSFSSMRVRPWVRFFARMLDILLFSSFLGFMLFYFFPSFFDWVTYSVSDTLLGFLVVFVFVFIEPLMLVLWGATPGKALLGIRLGCVDGSRFSYLGCLRRSFWVWVRGLGLGLPVVCLVAFFMAYRCLRREGVTSWDRDYGFFVLHSRVGFLRGVVVVLIFVVFFYIMVFEGR